MAEAVQAARIVLLVLSFISAIHAEQSGNPSSKDQCPQPDFLPEVPAGPNKHCVLNDQCSRAECVMASGGYKLIVILKINGCKEPLTATVTLQQPESKWDWSHTFKNGEKAQLPTMPGSFTGGLTVTDASLFIKVGLEKMDGNNLNYTVAIVGQVTTSDGVDPVNVILLEGKSPVQTGDCGSIHFNITGHPPKQHAVLKNSHDQGKCPHVHLPDGTECAVSNHCSKVTCTSAENSGYGGHMVLTVQMNGCSNPLTATVTMESSLSREKWSHTFKDGDKAVPPMPPGAAKEVHVFLKAELKKQNANVKFKLLLLMEKTNSFTVLAGELPLTKCGSSGKWFSKQPAYFKALVIVIPLIALVLVGFGIAFCCYKSRNGGLRFPIHISRGGSRVPMQRLYEV